jgi:phage replication-related protein YjqB (UPF0714/DUF867 family)
MCLVKNEIDGYKVYALNLEHNHDLHLPEINFPLVGVTKKFCLSRIERHQIVFAIAERRLGLCCWAAKICSVESNFC